MIKKDEKYDHATFKAEFPMGFFDYERYHELLKTADALAVEVLNFNPDAVRRLYAVLRVLYINFEPILKFNMRIVFRQKFEIIKKQFDDWYAKNYTPKFPVTLGENLILLYADILELRQYIGLGIKIEKDRTALAKLTEATIPV